MDIFANKITGRSFLKIIAPAVMSMLVISFYTVIDGLFVGRFVGENALAAINIVLPFFNLIFGISVMLGSGGSALVGYLMGSGRLQEAREDFSLIVATGAIAGLFVAVLLIVFLQPIVSFLGASDILFDDCYKYAFVIALIAPFIIHNDILEIFLRTDGRASLSLGLAVFGGVANIFFDWLFIVVYDMGITGAAWGTALSFILPPIVSTAYFAREKAGLRFVRPVLRWRILRQTFFNGSSEMVARFSGGLITFLFNIITMKYLGEIGVAAISIILYAHFLMISAYIGFSFGVAPLISYNFGSGNKEQLKTIMRYSGRVIALSAVFIYIGANISSPYIVSAFVGRGNEVFVIATEAMKLYSLCFLFEGFNIFVSAMFTAFSNGRVSAVISILHSVVFVSCGIFVLPSFIGVDGIWLTVPLAELLTLFLSYYCYHKHRKVYGY